MFDALLVVLPVFGIIGLGYVARLARYVTDRMGDGLSEYVNDIAIPFLIFQTLSSAQIPAQQPWGYWLSYFGGVAVIWPLAMWIAGRFFDYGHLPRVVAGFAAGQANTVLMGIPLILKAFGKAGEVPLFLLIAIHLPVTMTAATVLAEGGQVRPAAILWRLARHPILIAMALGVVARILGLRLADLGPVKSVLDMVAASAVPCALFSMGIAMRRYGLQAGIALPSIVTALKIIAHPLITYLLAAKLFAIDPVWAGVATLFAACPCGINAYLFAHKYKKAADFAATAIALSTAASVVTVTLWIWYLAPHA
jgi:malonate transporter